MTAHPPQGPPPPPDTGRRITFAWPQRFGLLLLGSIVALGASGVLADQEERVVLRSGALELTVEYPSRLRYHVGEAVRVKVSNLADRPLSDVQLAISAGYLEAFRDVTFTPPARGANELTVGTLESKASRDVRIELHADAWGVQQGELSVRAAGEVGITAPLRTVVLP